MSKTSQHRLRQDLPSKIVLRAKQNDHKLESTRIELNIFSKQSKYNPVQKWPESNTTKSAGQDRRERESK